MFREFNFGTRALSSLDRVAEDSSATQPDVSSETSKLPTYTTVGSIYNPHTATPLQPPTRRPRTRRYPPTVPSPGGEPVFGFPNALLSALPLKDRTPSSPPSAATAVPQYSPLQQNYDRAVSPVTDEEPSLGTGIGMSIPSIRSGNLPPSSSAAGLGISWGGKFNGDCESVASEDTLASSHINVKGLNSLASYPNPAQKAAQNTLAKARNTNLTLNQPDIPPSLSYAASDFNRERGNSTFGTTLGSAGVPQPLTAGPPGQRQLRRPSLEFAGKNTGQEQETRFDPFYSTEAGFQSRLASNTVYNTNSNHLFTAEHRARGATRTVLQPHAEYPRGHSTYNPSAALASGTMPSLFEDMDQHKAGPRDTQPLEKVRGYYPHGYPPNHNGRYTPVDEEWQRNYSRPEEKLAPQLSGEERRQKVNQNFNASRERLIKSTVGAEKDHDQRYSNNKVGVIGGGRGQVRTQHPEQMGVDGKTKLPSLTVAQANTMNDSVHAKPLLTMAFESLRIYKEVGPPGNTVKHGGFANTDPDWIDDSEEGNKSFFEKQKTEQKKKKVVRRTRRGY
ncbi:hypothetical protein B0H63DRAFT_530775 [Podospora didyma]|uniref:Uncharacterized protein n=1 Tax=Podospora didyma TaxID=330526 RepID=A0AAE0P4E6_9PEZI|nr:hypothetical protein B0H63DRAFT_530775 [Podospora didyma]